LTPGFVGADLAALCREAAMMALRRTLPHLDYQRGYIPYETLVNLAMTMVDFEQALEQLTIKEKAHLPQAESSSLPVVSAQKKSRFSHFFQRMWHALTAKA
jgi:SpoVK/Ycf46/Vps4 family AAA+-type ATPase